MSIRGYMVADDNDADDDDWQLYMPTSIPYLRTHANTAICYIFRHGYGYTSYMLAVRAVAAYKRLTLNVYKKLPKTVGAVSWRWAFCELEPEPINQNKIERSNTIKCLEVFASSDCEWVGLKIGVLLKISRIIAVNLLVTCVWTERIDKYSICGCFCVYCA